MLARRSLAVVSRRQVAPLLLVSPRVPVVASRARPAVVVSAHALTTTRAVLRSSSLDKAWTSQSPITYDELKPITQSPNDDVLVIDVREPDEVALGNIPSSVNVPLSSFEKSLNMDEGDFTRMHGFHKPGKRQPIVFYCRSGKRSATAIDLAKRAGFQNVRNYEGSWLDWESKSQKQSN